MKRIIDYDWQINDRRLMLPCKGSFRIFSLDQPIRKIYIKLVN